MRMRILTAVAALAAMTATAAPAAMAQAACEETQFSSKTGQLYLDAENAYVAEDFAGAKAKLTQLKGMALNCYERGAVIRLSAAVNVQNGDYAGAANDLEEAINTGGITGEDAVKTYYQIAQLYLQMDDRNKAVTYLERWIAAGANPDKNQSMQLAVLYNELGNKNEAIRWLEHLLRIVPNADKQTIDFAVYLYNETGQKTKLADFLMNKVIPRFASEKKYWEVMAGLYYEANQDRKAFEVTKAMYVAGLLQTENEVMRIVNFYNQFNAPYEAARTLEKEMNAGRVKETPEKLETLANLYQVAREYDRAIPVIQKFARATNSGQAYERLGRSYFELKKYDDADQALRKALDLGNMKEPGYAWILIGQMYHEQGERSKAREAFRNATKLRGGQGGNSWIAFMNSEDATQEALRTFDIRVKLDEERNRQKICDQTKVLGGQPSADCEGVEDRILDLETQLGMHDDKDEDTDET